MMRKNVKDKLVSTIFLLVVMIVNVAIVHAVADFFGGRGTVPKSVRFILIIFLIFLTVCASKGFLKAFSKDKG